MIAAILAFGVAISCVNGMYAAEREIITPVINTEKGAEISVENIERGSGGSITVDIIALNGDTDTHTYNLSIDIFNSKNQRVAGYGSVRTVNSGKSVPISFYTDCIESTEEISIEINALINKTKKQLYVSPDGDDMATGTQQYPLKTLEGAVNKIADIDASGEYNNLDIIFEGGNYAVNDTVNIEQTENLCSVTLKSADADNKAVFSGGISVTGADFTKVSDSGVLAKLPTQAEGRVYSLNLSDYGINLDFTNGAESANDPMYSVLYYNDNTQQIAKYPNEGYAQGSVRVGKDSEGRKTTVKSEEVKAWTDFDEAWLRGWLLYEWDLVKGRILQISDTTVPDTDSQINGKTMTLERLYCGSLPDDDERPFTAAGKNWFVYNLLEELDCEGEYAISDNVLYYYPPEADVSSGAFRNSSIKLNTDSCDMLKINGDNVTAERLVFDNSKGLFVNVAADNVKILGCGFKNNAQHAVAVQGNNNLVSSCDFYNLGGRGILMSGGDRNTLTSSESVLENCLFRKTGQINRTNCPPVSLAGCGITATGNTICDTPHSAFSYNGNNHIIRYNEFYNCLTDNAGDAGIIYTGNNLSNLGTMICNNYIHDSNSGLGAIYWDDLLSGQRAEGNVFENVDRALLIHGGVCNTFSSNIVINAQWGAQVRGKSRMKKIGGAYYNVWNEINGAYNAYNNVFLGNLVGIPESGGAYPAMPWQSDIWQSKYSQVLKYVNNKTNDIAEETVFQNNYFVSVPSDNAIYPYAGTTMSDLTLGGNVTDARELTAQMQSKYNEVVNNSGIYENEYRAVK